MNRLVTRLALLAALALSGLAFAGPVCEEGGPGPGHGPRPPEIIAENADKLGIDTATADEIQAIFDDAEAELRALHDAVRDAAPADREAAAEALHDQEKAVMEEVLALLSAEQVEALKALLPPPPPRRGDDAPSRLRR